MGQPTTKLSGCMSQMGLVSSFHCNDEGDRLPRKCPTPGTLGVKKTDISKFVLYKFVKDEEMGYENNPYMRECGGTGCLSPDRAVEPARDRNAQYLTLLTGTKTVTDRGIS